MNYLHPASVSQAKESDRRLACVLCLFHVCFVYAFGFLCGHEKRCAGLLSVRAEFWLTLLVCFSGLFSDLSCVFRLFLFFCFHLCYQFSSSLIRLMLQTTHSVTLFFLTKSCVVTAFSFSCETSKIL